MSENILKALMQLFAIIARPDGDEDSRRDLVYNFLKQQLNQELVDEYLIVFDNYYHKQKKRKTHTSRKGLSAGSVRVITICTMINNELTLKQKIIVVIRLLEFINSERKASAQELEFVKAVAEIFHITGKQFDELIEFVMDSYDDIPDNENILVISGNEDCNKKSVKHLFSKSIHRPIIVYHSTAANMYVFVYHHDKELYLNGQLIHKDRVYVLSTGSAIRDAKRNPVYYSDVVSIYNADNIDSKIVFEVNDLVYQFKNGVYGVNKTTFYEEGGKLIGIMGASGSGKSTLVNVLNGNYFPTSGEVLINGINLHTQKDEIEGIIGFVSQDDLLMEDLTVFQNLYLNAKLCFGNYSKIKLLRKVAETLKDLGLYEIKDMKVGSPLNKKISGGQRKRLNIALELIREPSILFLDEPTSGLSSGDSEHILDLLKELSLKGKLIFVVIHQPSSDIFKMFDRLLFLDNGGYLIYDGDPVDSIVYFKSKIKSADWNASECPECGNVTPEQIFNIVESKMLDEYGNMTSVRKTLPKEWYKHYNESKDADENKVSKEEKLPQIQFKIPKKIKQIFIFMQREVLSKIANKQYMLINLLEAPLLAVFLSYIIKYYNIKEAVEGYQFINNNNIPVYIFMSIIVSLFMGMTMSANEIIKDREILKRESFLNLSKSSYLLSKISILLTISAYQALTYTLAGNLILEIKGMFWEYWLVLFSSWAFAVLLGLNISDGFKTTVTIYIVIPFLIIPQIILSGVMVKYEELNPSLSKPGTIPWFGEIMTARWAYEALAVNQFTNNEYTKPIFKSDREMKQANFMKDVWIRELNKKIESFKRAKADSLNKVSEKVYDDLELLRNELTKEISKNTRVKSNINIDNIYFDKLTENDIREIKKYLTDLSEDYRLKYKYYEDKKKKYLSEKTKTDSLEKIYRQLKKSQTNKRLEVFVTNIDAPAFIEYDGEIVQNNNLIYKYPETFLKAHFYAPKKKLFGVYYPTLYVNVIVIWLYSILLYITLYYNTFRKTFDLFEYIKENRKFSKKEE